MLCGLSIVVIEILALLLKKFPVTGPRILVGPGENAGVVDIGCGQKLVFKIESHNHPSAVEPFQGAATGVGGILRDIFTMGARPIALLNALRFGPLEDEKNISLLEGVVAGISHKLARSDKKELKSIKTNDIAENIRTMLTSKIPMCFMMVK